MAESPCKICSCPTRSLTHEKSGQTYHVCDACEFIALDDAFLPSPQAERARYVLHENTCGNAGYVRMFRRFMEKAVTPYREELTSALDFGCGPEPVLAALLRAEGLAVDVYDPFFHPDRAYEGKRYSLITATEVIEHLADPVGTLRGVCGSLADGGRLAVMTLFHPRDDALFLKWWYRADSTHVAFYSPRTLHELAAKLGLILAVQDSQSVAILSRRGLAL